MKRYDLTRVHQNGKEFYVLVADPRVIVQLLPQYKPGEEQDVQRPWEEKESVRLRDMLPASSKTMKTLNQ